MKIILSRTQWEMIGKKAGWYSQSLITSKKHKRTHPTQFQEKSETLQDKMKRDIDLLKSVRKSMPKPGQLIIDDKSKEKDKRWKWNPSKEE